MTETTSVRPPLGLPNGSIRALLTLMIAAVVVTQLVRDREIEVLWTETLLIALAHYFASRRFIKLTPEVLKKLTDDGYLDSEGHPLFLPQFTIRAVLIVAFVGVAVYLYQQHRLFESKAVSILGVVFAYLLGIVARFRTVRGWEDLKAVVVLLVMAITAGAYLLDHGDVIPNVMRNVTLGLVLFYFGSR